MKTLKPLLLFLLLYGAFACEKETANAPEIPIQEGMLGDWLVVYQKNKTNDFTFQDASEGVVTSWGCFYILDLHLEDNGSFYVNGSHNRVAADSSSHALGGNWMLNSQQDSITFNCRDKNNAVTHTVTFKIYADKDGTLVLENEKLLLRHHKQH